MVAYMRTQSQAPSPQGSTSAQSSQGFGNTWVESDRKSSVPYFPSVSASHSHAQACTPTVTLTITPCTCHTATLTYSHGTNSSSGTGDHAHARSYAHPPLTQTALHTAFTLSRSPTRAFTLTPDQYCAQTQGHRAPPAAPARTPRGPSQSLVPRARAWHLPA